MLVIEMITLKEDEKTARMMMMMPTFLSVVNTLMVLGGMVAFVASRIWGKQQR